MNKVDRPDARIGEVVDEVYELFLDLDADEEQIEFPIVYTNAKAGLGVDRGGRRGHATCARCSTCSSSASPRPTYEESHPLQARVTNLDADPYVGRLALCRVHHGTHPQGPAGGVDAGATARSRTCAIAELYVNEGLQRVAADEAGPGRDHRARRHPGDHDRRDDRRPRRPAAAAA